ncbi:protein peste-like [Periplaneta americana]|uniref:protein peste-like n=1 Tax=Periplaneta americana TaxID=6978 RepID=UPI0037E772DF
MVCLVMERGAILAVVGILLAIIGTVLSFNWGFILHCIFVLELPLSPISKTYPSWQKSALTANIYLFNWTNPEQLLEENYVPEFVEIGPYSFKETFEKVNLTWNANNTVTFKRIRHWYFDPENSNGTMKDNITMLNVVPLSASYIARYWSTFSSYALSTGMRMMSKVWITKPAKEILFDGYDDPLMKIVNAAPSLLGTTVPGDKMGWYYGRNGSSEMDGVLNLFTAADDISKMGRIHSWNYNTRIPVYDGECGNITGSIGEFFAPAQTREKPVYIFNPDICRSIKLEYMEDTDISGLPAYRYEGSISLVDNGTVHPSTSCGCTGECLPVGVYNYSMCRYGIPAFLSYPHFYRADPFYLRQVKGLKPDPERHRFDIALEPTSGVPLDIAGRIQLNLLLQPNERNRMYWNMPRIMFPMLWFEELATVSSEDVWELKLLLMLPVFGPYISTLVAVLGLILLTIAVLPKILHYARCKAPHLFLRQSSEVKATHRILSKNIILTTVPRGDVTVKPPEQCSLLD